MAELVKSFVTLDKSSGSGNGTVTATANSSNTGRNARSVTATFSAANCADVPVTINQAGKPEFVTFDNESAAVGKTGGSATITGKSNSSKLTFSLGTGGTLTVSLPSKYSANSVDTSNGTAITGDPGATSQYDFSITISGIAANGTISAKSKQLIVTANGNQTATININQAAGDPTLSVSPTSVTIPWDASETKSVSVTSNTSWAVA